MGNVPGQPGGPGKDNRNQGNQSRWRKPQPGGVSFGRKKKTAKKELPLKIPTITPSVKCRLRLLKLERVKDYLLMEEEFISKMQQLKEKEQEKKIRLKNEGKMNTKEAKDQMAAILLAGDQGEEAEEVVDEDLLKVESIRGMPIQVGTLEEVVDEEHCIVSQNIGPE
jgi:26S proteasome regulatory subunit T2